MRDQFYSLLTITKRVFLVLSMKVRDKNITLFCVVEKFGTFNFLLG